MSELKLTKRQYKTLLELVSLGEWMVNAIRTEPLLTYAEVAQLVYAGAQAAGCGDAVERETEGGKFYPRDETKPGTKLADFKDAYDEETFWEELVGRLAERDLLREHGADAFERLKPEERISAQCALEDRYNDEFCERGLERLELVIPEPKGSA